MRITNNMITANTIKNINNAANRLNAANEKVATDKKISLPSDDPVVATRAITYRNYVDNNEQYQSNVEAAQSWQSTTDEALTSLNKVIAKVRDLTVQASSDTETDSDKANVATEISSLRDEAIDIMNSTYGGRYIFGGYSTGEAPYKLVSTNIGDIVTYKGKYLSLGGLSADNTDSDIATFCTTNASNIYSDTRLGTVTSTGTNTYTAANLSIGSGLDTGTYSINVAYDTTSSTYNFTLSDGTNSYTASSTSSTAAVAFTTSSGIVTLNAPSSGYADGDALSFKVASNDQSIKYNIGYDTEITVNTEGQDVVGKDVGSDLFSTFAKLLTVLNGGSSYKTYDVSTGTVTTTAVDNLDDLLTDLDNSVDQLTTAQADLGARETHLSNVSDSLDNQYTTYTTIMSNNENADINKAAIEESSAETVYDAALSVGAKAISKTLVDYLA